MRPDCCAEPVAGPAVDTRVLRHAWTALGPLVRGEWPEPHSLQPRRREETFAVLDGILAGLYLAVDEGGRLRWLGKAHRDGGVGARLRGHLAHAERARVFTQVFALAADPFSPPGAIEAAEGRAADLIGLRGRMGTHRWPAVSEAQWLALVTSRPTARVGRPRPAGDGAGTPSVAQA